MITADDIRGLSKQDKLRMMEILWSELTADGDDIASPEWHKIELQKTAKRVEAGLEEPVDWEEAKERLRAERK